MKTAIYIEDGTVQLVITPETKWEKDALASFDKGGKLEAQLFAGSFYDCRGGWIRQSSYWPHSTSESDGDRSLILRATVSSGRSP